MKRAPKIWTFTSSTFLLFLLVGWAAAALLGLTGSSRWLLVGGVWLLGLIAAILVFLWQSGKAKAEPVEAEGRDEIDVTFSAARNRLAAAKGKAAAKFGRLPVILMTGPASSAKTTIVAHSGMEPELLAGEVYRGDAIVPTSSVNVWFAQGTLVLEAGAKVLNEAGRWRRLIRHVQPSRLGAVFSRGRQAPRVAVVCFGCDELLKPGASEAVPAAAQRLRTRLAEVSQQIGIRLPVYVLFTKSDRLPYFEDFMRSLTREETRDVLGVTLTVPQAGGVGAYAERESRRLSEAFHVLFRGLALRRLDVLPRETRDDLRAGAYEFPREFRKITDLATQFLLDLCRPSQLGVSPFLRGFYFTGVRAVFLHDAGAEAPRAAAGGPVSQTPMDATGVFDPRQLQAQMAQMQAHAQAPAGSRKVPEWSFLERVFRDVIQKDDVARRVTAGGTKVNLLRRAVIAAAGVAALVFSIGFTVSFFRNRGLLSDARNAVTGARGLASVGPLPDLETLQRLDSLRAEAARLNTYVRGGHPASMGWGLYAGDRLQPEMRLLYFTRFRQLLWERTRSALLGWLRARPASPGENSETSEYPQTYDALKAYIVTSSKPDESKRDFLAPALMRFWTAGGATDSARARLAQAQFGFYADELPFSNPFRDVADTALVEQVRGFLRGFAGDDQFYRVLLGAAADSAASVQWADGTLRNDVVVPGAFTRHGWDVVQASLNNIQKLFDRETWVAGESAVPADARARLEQNLRGRYTSEYTSWWLRFLQGGRVGSFGSVQDASGKLRMLSSNQSPLLRMIGIVSDNTAVDTVLVGKAFKPAQDVVPPHATSVSDPAGKYLTALGGLQSALDQVATSNGSLQTQAMLQASSSAQQVKGEISGMARNFSTEGDARLVGAAIQQQLLAPVTSAESVIGALPVDEVNKKGPSFCAPLTQLSGKFPFSSASRTEATIDEVTNALQPGNGALWQFYQDALQDLLLRQGSRYVAKAGATPQADIAFVDFFNRAAEVSSAFFDENGDGPFVVFALKPQTSPQIPEVTVNLDGRPDRFTPTQAASRTYEWRGGGTSGAQIRAKIGNANVIVVDAPPGPWAVFHVFYSATSFERRGAAWLVTWRVPGQTTTLSAELSFGKGTPIFQKDYLGRLGRCVTRIAK